MPKGKLSKSSRHHKSKGLTWFHYRYFDLAGWQLGFTWPELQQTWEQRCSLYLPVLSGGVLVVLTFTGADVVGEGGKDFTGGRVWERWVGGTGEEIVPDWGSISMAGLEATGAEGWGGERGITPVGEWGLWITDGWARGSVKEKALEVWDTMVAWGATGMELLEEENGVPCGWPARHTTGSCTSLKERVREMHVRHEWATEANLSFWQPSDTTTVTWLHQGPATAHPLWTCYWSPAPAHCHHLLPGRGISQEGCSFMNSQFCFTCSLLLPDSISQLRRSCNISRCFLRRGVIKRPATQLVVSIY